MKINSINSQAFKGLLVIPESYTYDFPKGKRSESPKLKVKTDDIIGIDNSCSGKTLIKYNNENNELCTHTYYHNGYESGSYERSRVLLAYAAAATQKDIIIIA